MLGVAAMGGAFGAAPGAAGEDACALLTAEEIKGVVGQGVASSGHGTSGMANVCEYALGGGGQVMTTLYASSGRATFDASPGEALAGVGDQAKWVPEAGLAAVLKGETCFTVAYFAVGDVTDAQKLEYAKALAAKMLGRL